jgi:hypothetical protein
MLRSMSDTKRIGGIELGSSHTAYVRCAEAVLRHAGWWEGDADDLAALTGLAFHFISAPDACPSSVTAYDWGRVHQSAMARLGVHTEWHECGYEPTYELARGRAVEHVKASIDRGHPVIVWAPTAVLEFGLLTGYDDADGVFDVVHAAPAPADPLLYANLGRKRVPWLAYQVFVDCAGPDPDLRPAALRYARSEFFDGYHPGLSDVNTFGPRYAVGAAAYDTLRSALDHPDLNVFGLGYLLWTYADSKRALARWTATHGPADAAEQYRAVSEAFEEMARLAPFGRPTLDPDARAPLADLLASAARDEALAVESLTAEVATNPEAMGSA